MVSIRDVYGYTRTFMVGIQDVYGLTSWPVSGSSIHH